MIGEQLLTFLGYLQIRLRRLVNRAIFAVRISRKENNLTVKQLLDPEKVKSVIEHDEAYKILHTDRSSPAYWETGKKHVMGMIRQFGPPTLLFAHFQWLFVNKSETSSQEVDFHLLSMPVSQCSRVCQYTNTSSITERSRMLKSKEILEQTRLLFPDSEEIFVPNIIEYYIDRAMEELCLVDFVANYNLKKRKGAVEQKVFDIDFSDASDEDGSGQENEETNASTDFTNGIKLKNKMYVYVSSKDTKDHKV